MCLMSWQFSDWKINRPVSVDFRKLVEYFAKMCKLKYFIVRTFLYCNNNNFWFLERLTLQHNPLFLLNRLWNHEEKTFPFRFFKMWYSILFRSITTFHFFAFAFLCPKVNVCLSFYIWMPRSTAQEHCFLMIMLVCKYQKFPRPTIPCLFYLIKDLQRKRKIVRCIIEHAFCYRNYNFKLCSLLHESYY